MGFLKKIVKKSGRVLTSKSKTTRGALKIAIPVAGGVMLGGTALALFAARSQMQNSEQSTQEPAQQSLFDAGLFDPYGGFAPWAQHSLFKLGRSAVKRVSETMPGTQEVVTAGAAGAATGGGACAAPFVLEAVCRLCGIG